jgi:ribosomal protein S27AE
MKVKARKLIRYGSEPECPRCGHKGYDDWWHVLRDRKGLQPGGKLQCGACEKTFFIEGTPGNLFSTAFGLNTSDLLLRKAGR